MDLSKNLLIVLVIVFVGGVGTAYAGIILPTITLGGNVEVIGNLDMTNGKISNLAEPTNPSDAVTFSSIQTYEIAANTTFLSSGETNSTQVFCREGDIATGGGFFTAVAEPLDQQPRYLLKSFGLPLSSDEPPTSWIVTVHNPGPDSLAFNGYVVCLDVTPSPPV